MAQFIGKPGKKLFEYSADNFHVHEETTDASMPAMPKWPPSYPASWDRQPPQRGQRGLKLTSPPMPNIHIVLPSIPTIVGYLVIASCCAYTAYEAVCLLLKAFPQAIK